MVWSWSILPLSHVPGKFLSLDLGPLKCIVLVELLYEIVFGFVFVLFLFDLFCFSFVI